MNKRRKGEKRQTHAEFMKQIKAAKKLGVSNNTGKIADKKVENLNDKPIIIDTQHLNTTFKKCRPQDVEQFNKRFVEFVESRNMTLKGFKDWGSRNSPKGIMIKGGCDGIGGCPQPVPYGEESFEDKDLYHFRIGANSNARVFGYFMDNKFICWWLDPKFHK